MLQKKQELLGDVLNFMGLMYSPGQSWSQMCFEPRVRSWKMQSAWFWHAGAGERCDAGAIELCLFYAGFGGLSLTAEPGSDPGSALAALLIARDG